MLLRLSKKEMSAIEAVLDVALHGGGALVQSADITERQGIPPRYLEPILQRLGRAGILVGIRGPSGGYRLALERRRITLWDLVIAARAGDWDLVIAARAGDNEEARPQKIGTAGPVLQAVLNDLENQLKATLQSVTIEDLCWKMKGDEIARARRASPDFAI